MLNNLQNLSQQLLPIQENTDLVTFLILVNGKAIASEFEVKSIVVTKSANKIPYAKILVADGYVDQQDFPASNQDTFTPGNAIEIKAGYHSNNQTIFKGLITKHSIQARRNQAPAMEIECRDIVVKTTLERKNRYFDQQQDSEIFEDVLGQYPDIEVGTIKPTGMVHPHMVQYYCSDWDFLLTRADANACLVLVDDGLVTIQQPDFEQDPVAILTYGTTIWEFEAQMDARDQYPTVNALAWDYANQEIVSSENALGSRSDQEGPATLSSMASPTGFAKGAIPVTDHSKALGIKSIRLQHSGALSDRELDAWTNAQRIKSQLATRQGRLRFEGFSDIKPGQCLQLQGLGARFNEKVYLTGIRHEISKGNWMTDAQFGMPAEWIASTLPIQSPPASALLPAVSGLQIGLVTKIGGDPQNEDRVQVRLPLLDNNAEGVWARVACLDAGNNRGSFFRPEIDDEVIVGFLNDDPRHAIILGMLNSSAKPAPFQGSDDNHEKGFTTREQLKIHFHEADKSIVISTPGGKQIALDESQGIIELKDEFGNQITMEAAGITISAAAKLILKAGTQIEAEAPVIELSASASLKAESKGNSELSGGAMTRITGYPVMIN